MHHKKSITFGRLLIESDKLKEIQQFDTVQFNSLTLS